MTMKYLYKLDVLQANVAMYFSAPVLASWDIYIAHGY
jgi:hypothetical protein